jgi:hypothetical protein
MIAGSYVRKVKGYPFDGVVLSKFVTTEGNTRFVVEHADSGMLHIFNETQLEEVGGEKARNIDFRLANRQYVSETLRDLGEGVDE